MKRYLGFVLKFAVSVALIAYMATTFDLGDAAQRILEVDLLWMAAAALVFFILICSILFTKVNM